MTELLINLGEKSGVDVHLGPHIIRTDQSVQDGGNGCAPSPFDLFLASLGACAGYYVLAFCRERGLSTKGIRLVERIEHDETLGLIVKITIEIQLPPEFPEKYRAAVVRAADQCAVKKHLVSPPQVMVTATVI